MMDTLEIVQGQPVAAFLGEQLGTVFALPYLAIGYSKGGQIMGGAVFNGYTGRNVDVSAANTQPTWPRAFVQFFGEYLWDNLKVERATMITKFEHEHICLAMGAKREGVLRNWYPDADAVICGLLKEEWKLGR